MKTLPQYFAIKKCDNPLWKKYIEWLNEKYKQHWSGDKGNYYGYVGYEDWNGTGDAMELEDFPHKPTVLTLEEWNEILNEEVKKPKIKKTAKLTYQTIYKRSDGVEFTEGYIDGESIESLQERRKNHLSEANKITGKIREHNKLFN